MYKDSHVVVVPAYGKVSRLHKENISKNPHIARICEATRYMVCSPIGSMLYMTNIENG